MALTATITLNPTPLPDTGIWFANAAAFNNYMQTMPGTVDITAASTVPYVSATYDDSIVPAAVNIDGVTYILITLEMFASLKTVLSTLNTSYQDLRNKLYAAGIISNA